MQNKESVVAKIQKLLALAKDNANENERNQAMDKAQRLMQQHNLDMSKVMQNAATGQMKFEVDIFQSEIKRSIHRDLIVLAACKLYYTDVFIDTNNAYTFYGTPENIQVTISMAKWLAESIEREAKERGIPGGTPRNSFMRGAARSIFERAEQKVKWEKEAGEVFNSESSQAPGTALMVIRNTLTKANEEYRDKHLGHLRKGRTGHRAHDSEHYNAGRSYGNSVGLHNQIGGGTKRLNG